jgi:hypothetical protein
MSHRRPAFRLPRRTLLKSLLLAAAAQALAACAPRANRPLATFKIIPRAEWGAVEPDLSAWGEHGLYDAEANPEGWRVYDEPLSQVLTTIVVHHSALPLSDGLREIQLLHMQQKGFADVGYHYLIDDLGQIYQGRELSVRGAHAGGHNTGTVGIVLLGNFEKVTPFEAQLASLTALSQHLVDNYGLTHLAGHRDFQPGETACPGQYLEPLLPDLATQLGLTFGIEGYAGPQS